MTSPPGTGRWTTCSAPAIACCGSTIAASASPARPKGPYTTAMMAADAKAPGRSSEAPRLPPGRRVDGRHDQPGIRPRLPKRPALPHALLHLCGARPVLRAHVQAVAGHGAGHGRAGRDARRHVVGLHPGVLPDAGSDAEGIRGGDGGARPAGRGLSVATEFDPDPRYAVAPEGHQGADHGAGGRRRHPHPHEPVARTAQPHSRRGMGTRPKAGTPICGSIRPPSTRPSSPFWRNTANPASSRLQRKIATFWRVFSRLFRGAKRPDSD